MDSDNKFGSENDENNTVKMAKYVCVSYNYIMAKCRVLNVLILMDSIR